MPYKWKKNIACVSVYKTLEREDRMDQFEALFVPFEEAGDMSIGSLAFFPDAASAAIRKRAAKHFSAKFIKHVLRDYDVKKERPTVTLQQLFKDVVKVFSDKDKTLVDLAAVLDEAIKFEDE